MNYIDVTIIIILGSALLFGFSNGFVKEAATLAALVLGIWGAIKFSAFTTQKLYDLFDISGQYTGIAAFIITFVLIVIAVHFIGLIVDKFVRLAALGLINKFFGAAFRFLKAALIMSVIFCILNAVDTKKPFLPKGKIKQSALYNTISDIVPTLFPIISEKSFKPNGEIIEKSPNEVLI